MTLNDIYNTCINFIIALGQFGNYLFITVSEYTTQLIQGLELPDWAENALTWLLAGGDALLFGDITVAEFMMGSTLTIVFVVGLLRLVDSINPL